MEPTRILKKRVYPILLCVLTILFALGFLLFPTETAGGVTSGLELCLTRLLPATFPFVVLSSFCVYSGVSRILGTVLSPLTKWLFHLPGCCGSVILLGWLGGYPVGARGIVSLYQHGNITKQQGERLLWFCVSAGPSFSISVIGIAIYGDVHFGLLLFACQTTALFCMGVFFSIVSRIKKEPLSTIQEASDNTTPVPFSTALVRAADDGARGALNLCSFVMLFNAMIEPLYGCGILTGISSLLQKIGLSPQLSMAAFPILWEISSGITFAGWAGVPLWSIVLFTAMGGLCVWGQILAAVAPLSISVGKFFLSRILHGILSLTLFLICRPLVSLPEPTSQVFANRSVLLPYQISSGGTTPIAAVLCGCTLLLFCIVFLVSNKKAVFPKQR